MSNGEGKFEPQDTLARIEMSISSIQKSITGLEKRLSHLERVLDNKSDLSAGNPVIFSRVLMGTLEAIKNYEKTEHHGIVAKDLAKIRNVISKT